jgi:hypothetical protein
MDSVTPPGSSNPSKDDDRFLLAGQRSTGSVAKLLFYTPERKGLESSGEKVAGNCALSEAETSIISEYTSRPSKI